MLIHVDKSYSHTLNDDSRSQPIAQCERHTGERNKKKTPQLVEVELKQKKKPVAHWAPKDNKAYEKHTFIYG